MELQLFVLNPVEIVNNFENIKTEEDLKKLICQLKSKQQEQQQEHQAVG
ncbi:hypothetical protein G8S55_11555 [Clostridium botulinum C]|nr:hypothetical protein [Clostridium botulinum]MCD3217853.1 hypothetical protein [Clostridium botulinum C]